MESQSRLKVVCCAGPSPKIRFRASPGGGEMNRINSMLGGFVALMLHGQPPLSLKREEGQTLVEYALILAFIAIVVLVAVTFLSGQIQSVFSQIGSAV